MEHASFQELRRAKSLGLETKELSLKQRATLESPNSSEFKKELVSIYLRLFQVPCRFHETAYQHDQTLNT